MIYQLEDTAKVEPIFSGWEETMIRSCLQGIMGTIFVTDRENPGSACARLGDFSFFAGKPDKELVLNRPEGFAILTPRNQAWEKVIRECFPNAEKRARYALRKDTKFDTQNLRKIADELPSGYECKRIDRKLYDLCMENPAAKDFVSVFGDKDTFLRLGRGVVILKDGAVVSGASSYSRYREGIEIETDTVESERRKGLASAACASLILMCLEEGLYPSWDAQNLNSLRLAEKLGYEFSHEYTVFELF